MQLTGTTAHHLSHLRPWLCPQGHDWPSGSLPSTQSLPQAHQPHLHPSCPAGPRNFQVASFALHGIQTQLNLDFKGK